MSHGDAARNFLRTLAERVRKFIAKLAIKSGLQKSASVGTAPVRHGHNLQGLLMRVDEALYRAKKTMRPRVGLVT